MASEFDDISKVRHVKRGDPVAEKPTAQPTRALELRLQQLEQLVTSITQTGEFGRLIIRNVDIKTGDQAVAVDDVVFYNANTGLYEKALAGVTFAQGAYNSNPSSLVLGICVAVNGSKGDIMIAGYDTWRDVNQRDAMLESTEDFVPGVPYYLSDDEPGKVTRFAPALRIQVFMATEQHYILLPSYSNPESIEALYRIPMGMRPVGGIRAIPPDYNHHVIVGFDGIELLDATAGFNEWGMTQNSSVSAIANFGYMVADATMLQPVAQPVYVRVMVEIGGNINIISASRLEDLSLTGTFFNQVTGLLPLTAGTQGTLRSYTVKASVSDPTDVGVIDFKFITDDTTVRRDVIFKFPDAFLGWKMINAPVTPIATATVVSGEVTEVTINEPSVGYTTAPKVVITGTGTITTPAEGIAHLNAFGSIESIEITNPGAGYVTASIAFDVDVASIRVENGGSTAVLTPNITSGEITSVTINNGGTGYHSVPSLLVTDATGTGAIVEAEITGGVISGVNIVSQGTGYTAPRIIVHPAGPVSYRKTTQGIFQSVVGAGAVTSISALLDGTNGLTGGWGYPSVVVVTLTGGGGTGAAATASVDPITGAITGFVVTAPGTGYTTAPTVTVTPMDPYAVILGGDPVVPAAGTITLSDNRVLRINILSSGYGYDAATTMTLSGGRYASGADAIIIPEIEAGTGIIIAIRVLYPGRMYHSTPTLNIVDPGGDGNGLQYTIELEAWPDSVTVTEPGDGYRSSPAAYTGVPVEKIEMEEGGTGYTIAPTISIEPPDLPPALGGRTAVAMAYLGQSIREVRILSAGSGYTTPVTVNVTGGGGTGAVIAVAVDALGGVVAADIIDGGVDFTSVPTLTVVGGGGSGAILEALIEGADAVVKIIVTDPGHGYTRRPDVSFTPPVSGVLPIAQAKLMGEGSALTMQLNGEGGIHLSQAAVLAQGNNLQVKDYGDDLNDTPTSLYVKPTGAVFYYNIKADLNLSSRWPAVPVTKGLFTFNGTEQESTEFSEVTGVLNDPRADILFSKKSPMWTTFDADGCPWDREYRPLIQDRDTEGDDAVIHNTGPTNDVGIWVRYWEHVFKYEPNRNTGHMHVNKASRFYQSGRLAALGVLAPLKLIDVVTGTESRNDGTLMTGQLLLTLDDQVNFLGGTAAQIDTTQANNIVAIYQNTTGRPVFISSIILQVIYQLNGVSTPTVDDAALITVGTQTGNYRDIIGTVDPSLVTQQGKSTRLYAINRVKELLPDDRESSPLIMPNTIVYARIDYPVNSTTIQAQVLVAKIKGHVF